MQNGTYHESGPRKDLRLKNALVRPHPDKPDYVLAQFDALYLRESHGWHEFPASSFVNLRTLGAE
jgi:hypothetical protein